MCSQAGATACHGLILPCIKLEDVVVLQCMHSADLKAMARLSEIATAAYRLAAAWTAGMDTLLAVLWASEFFQRF